MNLGSPDVPSLFLPPVDRSMQTLDRAFFQKTLPLSAARVADVKRIAHIRDVLTKSDDLLQIHPIKLLVDDPDLPKAKCMLLKPDVKVAGTYEDWYNLHELI
jgi:tRNA (guanine37-N1)-methyltransferase